MSQVFFLRKLSNMNFLYKQFGYIDTYIFTVIRI